MQMHRQVASDHDDPGHKDLRQYPWGYRGPGETIDSNRGLDNYRKFATLHTNLFPYIYTYAKRATESGLPIIRPLVLMDPDDAETHGVEDEYHFGDELLVAPVLAPGDGTRSVYLRAGDWIDFWTNARHAGKARITWSNPDRETLPLYARSGAIVPMLLGEVETLCDANFVNGDGVATWGGGLRFRIYPSGTSRFTVYDGTAVTCQAGAGVKTVTVTTTPRAVRLSILGPRPAATVTRDGSALAEAASLAALDGGVTGWFHDATAGFLEIQFNHPGGPTIVRF
jgi:alpha-glucosidase (family GH31 glycosyl hydrolase)